MVPAEEAPSTITTCGGFVLQALVLLGLTLWGFWVARRHGKRPFWTAAAMGPIGSVGLWLLGMLVTIYMLIRGFGAVQYVAADQRSLVLSNAISEAMTAGALFLVPAALLFVGSLVVFVVGTFMRPSAPKSG